jgi:hypothetical protein
MPVVRSRAILSTSARCWVLFMAFGRRVISVWYRVMAIVQSRRGRVHSFGN